MRDKTGLFFVTHKYNSENREKVAHPIGTLGCRRFTKRLPEGRWMTSAVTASPPRTSSSRGRTRWGATPRSCNRLGGRRGEGGGRANGQTADSQPAASSRCLLQQGSRPFSCPTVTPVQYETRLSEAACRRTLG